MKKLLAMLLTMLTLFSAAAETAIANPWTETDPDGMMQSLGVTFGVPEGAENVAYRALESQSLAEMRFTLGEADLTARIRPANGFEDISGTFYEWTSNEPCGIGWCEGRLLRTTDGRSIADLCLWYDAAPGLMYSLSAISQEGVGLLPVAEAVYRITQDDAGGPSAEALRAVLEKCTGYMGTAGASLKEATAACALAGYAAEIRAAECDLSGIAAGALSLLNEEQRADLAPHLEGIRALLDSVFGDFDSVRGLFDAAGCLEAMETLISADGAQAHCAALLGALT